MAKRNGTPIHTEETDGLKQLSLNSDELKKLFSSSADVVFHSVRIGGNPALSVALVFIDGLADQKVIDDNIVTPLVQSPLLVPCLSMADAYKISLNGALQVSGIKPAGDMAEAVLALLSGKTLVCFDKLQNILLLDTINCEKRGIESSKEESSYRTSKDSFVETLRVNTSMLRRKIKSSSLVMEEFTAGRQSNSRVCVAYMRNICSESLIRQVKQRIEAIDQDRVTCLQDIITNVVRQKYALFPLAIVTEKPEACAKQLLDGKIVVILDEMPYSLTFPAVFGDFFQSSTDYAGNFILVTFFRLLRYTCFLLAVVLPGFYISIVTFHPEMIPYELAIRIAATRSGVPFSVFLEALAMAFAFFTLLQASMLISQNIGSAISIVGGLVLGQAAITAGLVSPGVIVVVAASAICSLAVPNKEINMVSWIFQIACILLSSVLGLIGIVIGLLFLLFMMARLTPLDVPYLAPFAGTVKFQPEDTLIKYPDNFIKKRPMYLNPKNTRRRP